MSKKTVYEEMIQEREFERLMAQEDLILEVTETIYGILQEKGIKKSAFAEMMGKTKGLISQMLSGGRNLTLRTIADMAFVLGYDIDFKLINKNNKKKIDTFQLEWNVDRDENFIVGNLSFPDEYNATPCDVSGAKVAA